MSDISSSPEFTANPDLVFYADTYAHLQARTQQEEEFAQKFNRPLEHSQMYWFEAAVCAQPEGSLIEVREHLYPQEGPEASGHHADQDEDHWYLPQLMFEEVAATEGLFTDSPLTPFFDYLGYRALPTNGDQAIMLALPNTTALDTCIDAIVEATGFAVRAQSYEGRKYPLEVAIDGVNQGTYYVATDPTHNYHDLAAHYPGWLVLTPSLLKHFQERISKFEFPQHNPHDASTPHALEEYMGVFEAKVDHVLAEKVARATTGDKNAVLALRMQVAAILTDTLDPPAFKKQLWERLLKAGKPSALFPQLEAVIEESNALIERGKQLITFAENQAR